MTTTRVVLGNSFADLPAALMQLGREELVPDVNAETPPDQQPLAGPQHESTPALDLAELPESPSDAEEPANECPKPSETGDLRGLVEQLAAAAGTLDRLIVRDREQREAALQELERYDEAAASAAEASALLARAADLHARARQLADDAIDDGVRTAARDIADTAGHAEVQAAQWAAEKRDEVAELERAAHVQRALAERARRAAAEQAAEEASAAAHRRREVLNTARIAAKAGWLDEAAQALRAALDGQSDDGEIAAALSEVEAQRVAARVRAAEAAVWAARVQLRRRPTEAIERLLALDLTGVPAELASQVFGEWTRACARLCRERGIARPLCYAPRRARGLVLVRERADRPYTVLSVLGMGRGWEAGAPVDDQLVRRALPLAGRGITSPPPAADRAA